MSRPSSLCRSTVMHRRLRPCVYGSTLRLIMQQCMHPCNPPSSPLPSGCWQCSCMRYLPLVQSQVPVYTGPYMGL